MLSHRLRCLLFLTLRRHAVNEKGKLDKVGKERTEAASTEGCDGKPPCLLEQRRSTVILHSIWIPWTFLLPYLIRRWQEITEPSK